MQVLAGIDGSQRACHAVAFATRVLSPTHDQIVLYCAAPKVHVAHAGRFGEDVDALARQALADALFQRAADELPQAFVKSHRRVVGDGKPIDGILTAARQQQADLIVVGAHGATERRPLFPGGVARGVAHRAEVPVMVVRQDAETDNDRPLRVLFAHCRTPACAAAAEALHLFHWPPSTQATMVHVVETLDPSYLEALDRNAEAAAFEVRALADDYRQRVAAEKERVRKHFAQDCDQVPAIFRQSPPVVAEGQIIAEIQAAVEREKIDLLVVGARSHSAVGRWLSSTTESLLLHCPCSLLIVHG